jgi:glycerate dehydrogenase
MPRIVIIDGKTLNPGDNPWTPIEELGEVTLYSESSSDQITDRIADAEIVITNKARLSATQIEAATNLKLIAVSATGYDCVDVGAAAKKGVAVCNVPSYGTSSVAQFTFALVLELAHRVALHDIEVRAGEWQNCGSFSFWKTTQIELADLTMGIIGFGNIGRQVGSIANAFGMRVIAHSRSAKEAEGVEFLELNQLAQQADVISLHCSLNASSMNLVNESFLHQMKPSAFLINTSRGALVDEAALASALNADRIAGAALDVVSFEPIRFDNPLLQAKNCVLTPHMAWSTLGARKRMMNIIAQNIRDFLNGSPTNTVKPQ